MAKFTVLFFSFSLICLGALSAQEPVQVQSKACACRDCKCSVQSNCGCHNGQGCSCGPTQSCCGGCGGDRK